MNCLVAPPASGILRWQKDGLLAVSKASPLMVTYHPSYLLRNASNRQKRVVWEDLLQVMERVGLEISDKQRGFFL